MKRCSAIADIHFYIFMLAFTYLACTSDTSIAPPVTVEPKLSSIQHEIFDKSCALPSCHGGGAGGLILTPGNSYSQLVGVQSQNDRAHSPPFVRVQPGNPDSSFLYIKITNPVSGKQGLLMPRAGGQLPQADIDAIRTWITNGAQNN